MTYWARRLFLLLPLLAVFAATTASATTAYSFNYSVTATGTQTVTTAPDQSFIWTVDGAANENWVSSSSITFPISISGPAQIDTYHIYPDVPYSAITGFAVSNVVATVTNTTAGGTNVYPVGSQISAIVKGYHGHHYSGYFGGSWSYYPLSLEVKVSSGGDKYESCSSWTGGCSTTIRANGTYSADYTIYFNSNETTPVIASNGGAGVVNFNEGDKVIDPSVLPVFPTPNGGTISGQSYTVSDDSAVVVTSLVGTAIHATTEVLGTATAPWLVTESGVGSVSEGEIDIPITTSSLVAPNADTVWSVTDDHLQMTTSMVGADVFASGLPAPVGSGNSFNYTVSGTGTETSDQYSDQSFNWTMNGTATESWQDPGKAWPGYAAGSGGAVYYTGGSYANTVTKSHTVEAPAPGVITGFTRTSVSLSHSEILSETINIDGQLIVSIRYSGYMTCPGYTPCYASNAGAQVYYDLVGYDQNLDPLTVTQSGTATVNAGELEKIVASVTDIIPLNGGTLSGETYTVTHDNALVKAWKSATDIVATTAAFGSITSPWSGSESGAEWVSPLDGLKLIGTTPLSAPNGDTSLSVSNDNASVITILSGTTIYAQAENDGDGISDSVDTDPLAFTNDFDDGSTTGSIVARGDQTLVITDAIDPAAGVLITALVGGGLAPAEVSVSGGAGSVLLDAGDSVVLTTSSADIEVIVGPVDAILVGVDGTVATVTVPAGNAVIFDPNTLTITTPVSNADVLVITVAGEPGSPDHIILPGALEILPSVVPPVVTVPVDFSIEATSPTGAIAVFVATAFDDIDGPLVPTCIPVSGTELALGVHTVTCEAVDSTPLTGSASFDITVEDTTQPSITTPIAVAFENNVPEGAIGVDIGTATATDLADPAPVISNDAPITLPVGDTLVVWRAEDASGNFIESPQTVTVICSAGSYQASGETVCTLAPAGSFVPSAGATAATLCAPGFYQSLTGQISCDSAPAGSFAPVAGSAAATLCAPGFYQSLTGQISCDPAPAGSFVPVTGASVAILCAPGTYQSITGQIVCLDSPAGSFAPVSGASVATLCAPGTYQSLTGQIVCLDSPAGSFVPGFGASMATLCAPGTYQSLSGTTFCDLAPSGSFVPVLGASAATLCAPGSFQPSFGQIVCNEAPIGTYVSVFGATSTTACGTGLTTLTVGSTSSTDCVDIVPPVLSISGSFTVEGNTVGGANVVLPPATATDIVDPAPGVSCDLSSGYFLLGAHTVTCTATDASLNVAQGSYLVTVVDTTSPQLLVPSGITDLASSSVGTIVNFPVSASDIVGILSGPDCTPLSGTLFAIGTTLVSCSVIDTSSNSTIASFTITVLGGRSLIQAAADAIAPYSGDDERFRNAFRDLEKALDLGIWADEVHPDPKHGNKVFDEIRSAIEDLEKLLSHDGDDDGGHDKKGYDDEHDDGLTDAQIIAIESAIDNVVTASRILASTAIADAEAGTTLDPENQPKVNAELSKAHGYFADAESSIKLEDVIKDFKKAWEHAIKAIKEQNKVPEIDEADESDHDGRQDKKDKRD